MKHGLPFFSMSYLGRMDIGAGMVSGLVCWVLREGGLYVVNVGQPVESGYCYPNGL